jgi:hypothetical protein
MLTIPQMIHGKITVYTVEVLIETAVKYLNAGVINLL